MTDTQNLKDDLAFLRDLTQDGGKGLARDGTGASARGGPISLQPSVRPWAGASTPPR